MVICSQMKGERILIIGAGGQLGTELTAALAAKYGNENLVATDIKETQLPADVQFEKLNVLEEGALDKMVAETACTQIFHLAAVLSAKGEEHPDFAWKLNMDSLLLVLEAARTHRVSKVFWPSSIAVFGPTTPKHQTPQHTIMEPTTVYGISKLAGERWCEWYSDKYGIDVRSLRYPGLIGYKSKPGGGTTDYAVDIFFKAIEQRTYTCFLKADTYLPMMYMEDAIKATMDLMDAPAEQIKVRSGYNVSAMSFSPEEIAAEITKHIPDFEITYSPDFRQEIADSWPRSINDQEARTDWNWKPGFDLKKMTETILHHLSQTVGK